jgi:hypothetical protein
MPQGPTPATPTSTPAAVTSNNMPDKTATTTTVRTLVVIMSLRSLVDGDSGRQQEGPAVTGQATKEDQDRYDSGLTAAKASVLASTVLHSYRRHDEVKGLAPTCGVGARG